MMNTKQELFDAMDGVSNETVPPAIFTQTATTSQMEKCGAFWPDAIFDIDKMVELAIQPSKVFGYAMARVPFDLTAEADRLGCSINKGSSSTQPAVVDSPWRDEVLGDVPDFMPVDEFLNEGRCHDVICAADMLSRNHDDLFIVTSMIDPFELSSHIAGMENILMQLLMDCDNAGKWVDAMVPYQVEYAKALSEVSDNVLMIVEGAEDILPPSYFEQFIAKHDVGVFSSMKESYSTAHTCGMTNDVLYELSSLGEDVLSVESDGDPENVIGKVSKNVRLAGGINPIRGLMQGKPESIVSDAKRYSESGYSFIAPECGVPPMTSDENLYALAHYREM